MPRTSGERNEIQVSVRMTLEDRALLEKLMENRGYSSLADMSREIFGGLRTLFDLPAFMEKRLRSDMKERHVDVLKYLQEVLALHFQQLESASRSDAPSKGRK